MSTATTKTRRSSAIFDALADDSLVQVAPIDMVVPAKDNPRRDVGDVTEIASSIAAVGILEPLLVNRNGGKSYTIVCGHRRFAAAKVAGLEEIPVIVRDLDDKARAEIMLIENLQREDLSALEEASAYERLGELGMSQRDLAQRIGRSQSHISKRLALLELPKKVLEKVDSGGITLNDAVVLTKLKDEPARVEAAVKMADRWTSIGDAVRVQLKEQKAERKGEETRARLTEAGIAIVDWPRNWFAHSHKRIGKHTYDGLEHVKVKDHAKEPCHAAAIHPDTGERVYVCTQPKRHASPSQRRTEARHDKRDEARKRHEKEMRQARKDRTEFVAALLQGRTSKTEAIEALVTALVGESGAMQVNASKIAVELLGLEPVVDGRFKDYRAALLANAEASTDNPARVALALAVAVGEERTRNGWGFGGDLVERYYELLERHGYETSAAERRELAQKAPQ